MKSPEQIRDMEFQKVTVGGYKQSDVELFLEEVASQIEILMKQKTDAERKLQEMTRNAPEAALSASGIQNVLLSAQRVADQVAEDAKQEAQRIIADANLKLTSADIRSKEIIADAEGKAILLGKTAEEEAAKIIAAAVKESESIIAEAKESIELEQKLYDRMKIEISDFRKKAAQQCSALVELINQLPGEVPFNLERSKTVLSMDFSDPEQLLKAAVEERLAKEYAEKMEAVKTAESEVAAVVEEIPVAAESEVVAEEIKPEVTTMPEAEPVVVAAEEVIEDTQLSFGEDAGLPVKVEEEIQEAEEEEAVPFAVAAEPKKSHISFGEDDDDEDDDDDDDEPRLFFRRKKK